MNAEIFVDGATQIDFSPPSVMAEIAQNIRCIITTVKQTVPMFREFGLDVNIIDSPINEAGAKLKSNIIMAVRKYEPRAKITSINFEAGNNGNLGVRITFDIKEASA